MKNNIPLDLMRVVEQRKARPVSIIAQETGLSEEQITDILKFLGHKPVSSSKTPIRDSELSDLCTIPEAMKRTELSYEVINDAVLAGELPVQRPQTLGDSYGVLLGHLKGLTEKNRNKRIKPRRKLRSERLRDANDLNRKRQPSYKNLFLDPLLTLPLLTSEEENELLRQVKDGDEAAVDDWLEANMRLLIKQAKPYASASSILDFLDTIQEGFFGLKGAILKSDLSGKPEPWRPRMLAKYAKILIRAAISDAICRRYKSFPLPRTVYERQGRIATVYAEFIHKHGVEPYLHQLTPLLSKSDQISLASDLKWILHQRDLNMPRTTSPVSIDQLLPDGQTLCDLIEDKNSPLPSEVAIRVEEEERVRRILDQLTIPEKHKRIFLMRYGLEDGRDYELKEVGERYGVRKGTVFKICKKVLDRIRIRQQEPTKNKGATLIERYRQKTQSKILDILHSHPELDPVYNDIFIAKCGYSGEVPSYEDLSAKYSVSRDVIKRHVLKRRDVLESHGIYFDVHIHFSQSQLDLALDKVAIPEHHKSWYKAHFGFGYSGESKTLEHLAEEYKLSRNMIGAAVYNSSAVIRNQIMLDFLSSE